MEEKKTELKMIKMSEVQSQEIEWLWYPFIPYGKLTIVQGDPGDGKTTESVRRKKTNGANAQRKYSRKIGLGCPKE